MVERSDLSGKVILITGASRGIGYAAGLEAARRGAHVIAVARTIGGLEDLDDEIQAIGGSTTLVPLDLREGDAIDRLGAAIFERWGRLDGLVGNAASLDVLSPLPHIKPDAFDKVFALNVTANYRLVRSFDLLLREADAGRAVFVSSNAARNAKPYWGLYGASKAALEAMVSAWAGELGQTRVRANVFVPGPTRTALRAKAMPGEKAESLPAPGTIAPRLVDMLAPDYDKNGVRFDVADGTETAL